MWPFKSTRQKLHASILLNTFDMYDYFYLVGKLKPGLTSEDIALAYDNKCYNALNQLIWISRHNLTTLGLGQRHFNTLFDNNLWGNLSLLVENKVASFTDEQLAKVVEAGSEGIYSYTILGMAFTRQGYKPTPAIMAAAENAEDWEMLQLACDNGYLLKPELVEKIADQALSIKDDDDNASIWSLISTLAQKGQAFTTAHLHHFLAFRALDDGSYNTAIYMLRAGTKPTPAMPLLVNTEFSGGIECKLLLLKLMRGEILPDWHDRKNLPNLLNALFTGDFDAALTAAEAGSDLDADFLQVIPPSDWVNLKLITLLAEKFPPAT